MTVSCHQRSERQVVVDIFVAVEIAELAAAGLLHENRPRIVCAIVAGYAKRNAFEIFLVCLCGLRGPPFKSRKFFLQIGIHRGSPGNSSRLFCSAIRLPGGRTARGIELNRTALLEVELQSKLDQTRIAGLLDLAKGRIAKISIGVDELRFVKEVKDVRAELEISCL